MLVRTRYSTPGAAEDALLRADVGTASVINSTNST